MLAGKYLDKFEQFMSVSRYNLFNKIIYNNTMKFKDIKEMIYSDCRIVKGRETISVSTHEPTIFDENEVIGIRSRDLTINGYNAGSYIEVLVK